MAEQNGIDGLPSLIVWLDPSSRERHYQGPSSDIAHQIRILVVIHLVVLHLMDHALHHVTEQHLDAPFLREVQNLADLLDGRRIEPLPGRPARRRVTVRTTD